MLKVATNPRPTVQPAAPAPAGARPAPAASGSAGREHSGRAGRSDGRATLAERRRAARAAAAAAAAQQAAPAAAPAPAPSAAPARSIPGGGRWTRRIASGPPGRRTAVSRNDARRQSLPESVRASHGNENDKTILCRHGPLRSAPPSSRACATPQDDAGGAAVTAQRTTPAAYEPRDLDRRSPMRPSVPRRPACRPGGTGADLQGHRRAS